MNEQDLIGKSTDDVPKRDAGENCNARRTSDGEFVGYCKRTSGWGTDKETGRCSSHGGKSPGAKEGNDWAAKHGAWSDSFMSDFLTEKEQARVEDAVEVLGTPEGAQEQARVAAVIALEQFRRTGDDRFMRRYESICSTFSIAPDEEPDTDVDVNVEVTGLDAEEKQQLDAMLDRDVQE